MSDRPSVSVQTRINAPLEDVWQVLTDFGRYGTWHPILTLDSHAGPLAVGTVLRGQSSGGPAGQQSVAFTIARVEEPNYLAWTGGDPEVVAGRHSFQLERLAAGTTELTESEVFTGPAAPEVIGRQLPELHAVYETFAAALKKRAEEGEGLHGGRGQRLHGEAEVLAESCALVALVYDAALWVDRLGSIAIIRRGSGPG